MTDLHTQRLARRQANALAAWSATRAHCARTAQHAAVAVLDLHKPIDWSGPCCSHCTESVPGSGTSAVAWPCDTYDAIREALGDD